MENKNKTTRNRYSLVVENEQTKEKIYIPIKQYHPGKKQYIKSDKAELFTIDRRTTDFEDYQQLGHYLYEEGQINFPVTSSKSIYIEYQSNGPRKLDVAYKNDKQVRSFSHKMHQKLKDNINNGLENPIEKYIDQTDNEFNRCLDKFLSDIQKAQFYRFITSNQSYLNPKLKEKVDQHYVYTAKPDLLYTKKLISKEVSRYKTLRGILIGTRNYQQFRMQIEPQNKEKIEKEVSLQNWQINQPMGSTEREEMIINVYQTEGHEGLFNRFDIDEIYSLPEATLQKLGITVPQNNTDKIKRKKA